MPRVPRELRFPTVLLQPLEHLSILASTTCERSDMNYRTSAARAWFSAMGFGFSGLQRTSRSRSRKLCKTCHLLAISQGDGMGSTRSDRTDSGCVRLCSEMVAESSAARPRRGEKLAVFGAVANRGERRGRSRSLKTRSSSAGLTRAGAAAPPPSRRSARGRWQRSRAVPGPAG